MMNFKEIFHVIAGLVASPYDLWKELSQKSDDEKELNLFVYPMILLCGLAEFLGSLMAGGWTGVESLWIAITQALGILLALFIGFFLATYLMNACQIRFFEMESDLMHTRQFAGYAMGVTFVLHIMTGLMPHFIVLSILLHTYLIYVVWEGAQVMMGVKDKHRLAFTITASALLLLCPALILKIFQQLTMVLN